MGERVCENKMVTDGLSNQTASYSSSTAAAVPLLPQEKARRWVRGDAPRGCEGTRKGELLKKLPLDPRKTFPEKQIKVCK